MKKTMSFMLAVVLILSSFSMVFAAEATTTAVSLATPSDVAGTSFETAVKGLIEDGVISGYPDGTYRPKEGINRAAACVIVVRSMGASEANLTAAAASGFKDLSGYAWAVKYINYAVAKGVVKGYPNGTFAPGKEVTYNEMTAMLVQALGYKVSDLSGTWPTNFYSKAKELGMLAGVPFKGDYPALRGYVAMMDYSVVDKIVEANKTGTPTLPKEDTGTKDPAGQLAAYSGRAYGIVADVATTTNKDGDKVQELEFLLGDNTLYVKTKGSSTGNFATLAAHLAAGDLYGLKMSNGVVTGVDTSDTAFAGIGSPSGFENLLGAGAAGIGWANVNAITNHVMTVQLGVAPTKMITILEDASIYVAKTDGATLSYEAGSLSDIDVNSKVRAFSVTGDEPGVAEIVLVKQ